MDQDRRSPKFAATNAKLKQMWRQDDPNMDEEFTSCFRQWDGSDSPENYEADGNAYTPDSFGYHFNAHGFRCDEFNTDEHYDARILFLGCSFTNGTGLPVEEVYAHRIITALRQDGLNIPYWNAAMGGRSGDWCARAAYKLVPFLRPDILFVLMPTIHRHEVFVPTRKPQERHFHYLNIATGGVFHTEPGASFGRALEEVFTDTNDIYHVGKNLAFLHIVAKLNNCRLMWSNCSWQSEFYEVIHDGNPEFSETRLPEYSVTSPTMARDKRHCGAQSHENYANLLLPFFRDILKDTRPVRGAP